jgi:hypothetical protein
MNRNVPFFVSVPNLDSYEIHIAKKKEQKKTCNVPLNQISNPTAQYRLHLADSSPVDNTTYELCSDMIDVVIDVSSIYGVKRDALLDASQAPDGKFPVFSRNFKS